MNTHNPWAGLASYEDPEISEHKLKFCGRDDDSYDVTKLILGNILVTLYGKSGIGKTSLLNAGVFPELRDEHCTPLSMRLGMRDEKAPNSYQSIIINSINCSMSRIETINVIEEQRNENAVDYLWNYFARHRFYDKFDEPTSPVMVFDQFEEVFRTNREEADTLLRQLDYINDKDHTLDNCTIDGQAYRYETNFRFVVSIREDDLYRLEDSIDNCYLPALKRCRYRLRSLSEQGARDVILIPGKGLFCDEEQEQIVQTILNISRNKEDQSISTNLLSLICNRIYVEYQRRQVLDHINQALVDNFIKDNPFERFYNEATRGFSNREKNYIEDHFVDSTGRRNSLPESDFLYHVKNGSKLLEGNARILQRISTSSDGSSYRVELIHDSFCEPLVFLKEKRERQNRIKRIATAAATFFLLLGIIGSFVYLLNKLEDEKIQRTKAEKKVKVHEDFKKLEASISLIPTYIDDDIKYSNYGFSERSDLDDWKSENEELCRSKISNLLSDSLKTLKIKKEMKDSEPALVYLILKSQSLKTIHEKQEWFEMWDIMNDEQVFKLYDILTRERYKLSVLSYKDNAAILNNEAYRHAQNGNFDEALSTIDKSIEKARVAYANKYDTKGEILLMKGNTQEAVKMWNKVLDISPNFLDYYDGSTPFYEQLRKRGLIE